MKVLVVNIGWRGNLGWMLDEALQKRGVTNPASAEVETVQDFDSADPARLAELATNQLTKPGWTPLTDDFTLQYGDQRSAVFVFGT